jgi:hypothetical protein
MASGKRRARSQIVFYYSVLAPLCDAILDRVPIYWATHQEAALHKAIEGYADVQFANTASAFTGSSKLLQKLQVSVRENHQLSVLMPFLA